MVKIIAGGITALLVAGLGVYFIILYISTQSDGTSISVAGLGVLFILVAMYCTFLLIKPLLFHKKGADDQITLSPIPGGESLVSRNNKMIDEYDKTAKARNKLKTLQAAAAAEES